MTTAIHPDERTLAEALRPFVEGSHRHIERRLADALSDTLITGNLGLAWKLAGEYRGRGLDYDDLVQEGTLGLIRAARTFDASRGVPFSAYAVMWIRIHLARATSARRFLQAGPLGFDPLDPSTSGEIARLEAAFDIHDYLARLGLVERWVICQRYGLADSAPSRWIRNRGHHRSLADLASELGVDKTHVLRIERHALARLRELIAR
jgi:RNA polymerase sigma factor (sigma-70 family)